VCIMQVVEQLDAGDILASASIPIASNDTVVTLREKLGNLAIPLLVQVLTDGPSNAEAQFGDVVIASKITSNDLRIDWSQDALSADRQVRVGGAFTMLQNKRLKIHSLKMSTKAPDLLIASGSVRVVEGRVLVACAHGCVELVEVQPEGKSRIGALDWSLGARLDTNSRFD